jgi:hypothetical protein
MIEDSGMPSIALLALFAASGVSQGTPAAQLYRQPEWPCENKGPPASHANKGLLFHLRADDPEEPEHKPQAEAVGLTDGVVGGYTRLQVNFKECTLPLDRDYGRERRGWYKRWFAHKLVGKVLTVSALVKPLGVSATRTLTSVGRDSGGKGEVWNTSIDNDQIILPYFRTDSNANVELTVKFASTREYDMGGASLAVDLARRAATLITPSAALVTTLNKERFNQASNFVDSTIAGILKVAINEELRRGVRLTGENQTLLTLTLFVSQPNDPFQTPSMPIGRWEIIAERLPNDSVFATKMGKGNKLSWDLSAASILNFRIDGERRLKEVINATDSVQKVRDDLLLAKDKGDRSQKASKLCRTVAIATDAQGFSPRDVGLAVWAYLDDLALPFQGDAYDSCSKMDHWPTELLSTPVN